MIRKTTISDVDAVYSLYIATALIPGGLARNKEEITKEYIFNFISKSIERGLSLVLETNGRIVAELHAYTPEIKIFSHILSELTICVHPSWQRKHLGRKIFSEFMKIVQEEMKEIQRVELIARETNVKAIKFYQSLGFEIEGCLRNRVDGMFGELENDIPMGWVRVL